MSKEEGAEKEERKNSLMKKKQNRKKGLHKEQIKNEDRSE